VLLFMTLAETLGEEKIELELQAEHETVLDIIRRLRERGDDWHRLLVPERMTITVNKQFVEAEQALFDGDEIAFVPKA